MESNDLWFNGTSSFYKNWVVDLKPMGCGCNLPIIKKRSFIVFWIVWRVSGYAKQLWLYGIWYMDSYLCWIFINLNSMVILITSTKFVWNMIYGLLSWFRTSGTSPRLGLWWNCLLVDLQVDKLGKEGFIEVAIWFPY